MINDILFRELTTGETRILLSGFHEGTEVPFDIEIELESIKEYAKNVITENGFESYVIVETLNGQMYQLMCEDFIVDELIDFMYMYQDCDCNDCNGDYTVDFSNEEDSYEDLDSECYPEVMELIKKFIEQTQR